MSVGKTPEQQESELEREPAFASTSLPIHFGGADSARSGNVRSATMTRRMSTMT